MVFYPKVMIIFSWILLHKPTEVIPHCHDKAVSFSYTENVLWVYNYPSKLDGYGLNRHDCYIFDGNDKMLVNLEPFIGTDDYVRIFSGPNYTSLEMEKTDVQGASEMALISPPILLEIKTDGVYNQSTDKGVRFYRLIRRPTETTVCNSTLNATTATKYIFSPNSPNSPYKYPDSGNCYWNIAAATGTTIKVVLHFVDVEYANNCMNDYLQVLDPAGNDSAKICGNEWDFPFFTLFQMTSKGNNLQILLVSDANITGYGYFFAVSSSAVPHGSSPCNNNNICVASANCVFGTCQCKATHYNDSAGMCNLKKELGSRCENDAECATNNSMCLSSACTCSLKYYDDNGIATPGGDCHPAVLHGNSPCNKSSVCVKNAACVFGVCLCNATHYNDSAGMCNLKKELESGCKSAEECVANNSVCVASTCKCPLNYYDDNGIATPGGDCQLKSALNQKCSDIILCNTKHAECLSGICTCPKDNFHEADGECISDTSSSGQKIGIIAGVTSALVVLTALLVTYFIVKVCLRRRKVPEESNKNVHIETTQNYQMKP